MKEREKKREEPSWPQKEEAGWGEVQEEKEKRDRKEVGREKASSKLLGFEGSLGVQAPYLSVSSSRYERSDAFSQGM